MIYGRVRTRRTDPALKNHYRDLMAKDRIAIYENEVEAEQKSNPLLEFQVISISSGRFRNALVNIVAKGLNPICITLKQGSTYPFKHGIKIHPSRKHHGNRLHTTFILLFTYYLDQDMSKRETQPVGK